MPILPYRGVWPAIAEDVFIAPGAVIVGDVRIGPGSSVWYNVVIRADTEKVVIGARTNIQDNACVHIDPGAPCVIGDDCTLGHGAIVHGATVGDHVLVAMHATVLSRATVGDNVIIGAGALVPEGKSIPGNVIVLGVPGRIARELTPAEEQRVRLNAAAYVWMAQEHRASLLAAGVTLDEVARKHEEPEKD